MSQNYHRKASCAVLAACLMTQSLQASAQSYQLQVETFATHEGMVGSEDLSGMSTYRFYLATAYPDDEVISVFGNDEHPLTLTAELGFFNSEYVLGATAGGITPDALVLQPEVEFDSYVTIGLTQEPDVAAGEVSISISEDINQEWSTAWVELAAGAGAGFVIDTPTGGSWSTMSGASNAQADASGRVYVMQLTTINGFEGTINFEVAVGGDPNNTITTHHTFNGLTAAAGCTDSSACNYDADAPVFPGSELDCVYADDVYDCDGNCLADSDGDGVCDPLEVAGCQDELAYNYDPAASDDSGDCVYPDELGCHDEAACNFEAYVGGELCLQIETVLEHDGMLIPELAGYTTYRVYALCPNQDDFVSSVSGDSQFPTYANSDAPFYQSPFGGAFGNDLMSSLFGMFPATEFDSFLTIGLEGSPQAGEGIINSIDSPENPWAENFENQGFLAIDDLIGGAWYIFNGNTNGIAGEDHRVLLGQFTAQGNLDGQMYVQVFLNGNPSTEVRQLLSFGAACYGPETNVGCEFPAEGYDCNGDCLADADGDGVCDAFETPGCTDASACNFDDAATEADGSCTYPDAGYNCDGSCVNDADGDGVCDEFEIFGCTDAEAVNFDAGATEDDGTCIVPGCNDEAACNFEGSTAAVSEPCLAIETYAIHTGTVGTTDLTGYTTYRVYATLPNADDFLSSVSGDSEFPTFVNTSTAFYQNAVGAAVASNLNASLFSFFPELNADSWVTIGLDGPPNSAAGEGATSVITSDENDWVANFEAGGNLEISDAIGGAWYALNGQTNAVAGEDLRILVGQFTTSGTLEGQMYLQVFLHGNPADELRITLDISNACQYFDNNECVYPTEGLDCDGICLNDADSDGICDEDEIPGCTDAAACNFDAEATDNDGSCDYPSAVIDCEGNCVNDADGDGVCDENELAGCTDAEASNFQPWATDDNGSCFEPQCNDEAACNYTPWAGAGGLCVQIETVAVHSGMVGSADLTGQATYRVYAITDNADDFISSVAGDAQFPTNVNTTTSFYQSPFGAGVASNLNAMLLATFPEVSYDSWVTIGLEGPAAAGQGAVTTVASDDNDWLANFEAGGNIAIDDEIGGAWFIFGGSSNGIAGEDHRVLLGQFTTDGILSGQLYVQAFINGSPENVVRETIDLGSPCSTIDFSACTYPDAGYDCDGICLNDADGDGICDEFEIGGCDDATACNFDPSATDNDGSCVFAEGNCESCDGNGGIAVSDADGDGVCDADEIPGCTDAGACNYNAAATDEDGSCVFADGTCEICDGNGGTAILDADGDGVCDGDEIAGCMVNFACNYDPVATDDDGSCVFALAPCEVCAGGAVLLQDADGDGVCDGDEIAGCTDSNACNYDATATDENGSCTYPEAGYDCDGACLNDADGDLVCDEFEIPGCTDAEACNFDADATDDNGSCSYPASGYDCDGVCLNDSDGDGVCDEFEIVGCQDEAACNYDATATDAGSCDYPETGYDCNGVCLNDADGDGVCDEFEIVGCQDDAACNYDATATDAGSCDYPEAGYDCDGNCLNDADGDLVCDEFEIVGCQDDAACNYDATATDAGSCDYPEAGYDCDGNCLNDADGDGVCDEFEIAGCQDPAALNYDPTATDEDGSCDYPVLNITVTVCEGASEVRLTGPWWGWDPNGGPIAADNGDGTWTFTFDPAPTDNMEYLIIADGVQENLIQSMVDGGSCAPVTDYWSYANRLWEVGSGDVEGIIYGSCDSECPVLGCTDATACNFYAEADENDGSCTYPEAGYDCDGTCLNDGDGDGICDEFEIVGCQDDAACNYDAAATDAGDCTYADAGYDCDGVCLGDVDGDGVCDANEIPGCMDAEACNYNAEATDENGTCTYPINPALDCEGNCVSDIDGDGVCDEFEIGGCMDETACNYDANATDDDGSCTFPNCIFDCDGACNNDVNGNGICDELEGQDLSSVCGPGTVWNEEMGWCEINPDPCYRYDTNNDGHIQLQDLMDFLEVYGTYCD
jgi:hypothetical protein